MRSHSPHEGASADVVDYGSLETSKIIPSRCSMAVNSLFPIPCDAMVVAARFHRSAHRRCRRRLAGCQMPIDGSQCSRLSGRPASPSVLDCEALSGLIRFDRTRCGRCTISRCDTDRRRCRGHRQRQCKSRHRRPHPYPRWAGPLCQSDRGT